MRSSSCPTVFRARSRKPYRFWSTRCAGARALAGTPSFAGRSRACPSSPSARPACSTRSRKSTGNSFRHSLPARNKMGSGSRPSIATMPRRSCPSWAMTPAGCFLASGGCCASCAWRRAMSHCRTGSIWRRRRSTRFEVTSLAIVPRPTLTMPGTWRSGTAISASWPSSAPTPSS